MGHPAGARNTKTVVSSTSGFCLTSRHVVFAPLKQCLHDWDQAPAQGRECVLNFWRNLGIHFALDKGIPFQFTQLFAEHARRNTVQSPLNL
jgi:hypothetical protein